MTAALYAVVMLAMVTVLGLAFIAFILIAAVLCDGLISAYWHLIRPLRARQTK